MNQQIVLEPDGRAVVVYTPYGRSIRFASEQQAVAYLDHSSATVVPVLAAGALLALLNAVLPSDTFTWALAIVLPLGLVVSTGVHLHGARDLPEYETLDWDTSARLDGRPLFWRDLKADLPAAISVLLLFGGVLAFGYADWRAIQRDTTRLLVVLGAGGLFGAAAVVVGWMMVQKVRYIRAWKRVFGPG